MSRENRWIATLLSGVPHPESPQGPGDDAAVIDQRVVTTDAFIEGTHFLAAHPPAMLAHKVVYASASDVSAMGSTPRWLTLAAALPIDLPDAYWQAFAEGFGAACTDAGLVLVGGDTVRSPGPLMFSLTVVGDAPLKPLTRAAGRPGDVVLCHGHIGRSGVGLQRWLAAAKGLPWLEASLPRALLADPCVRHHLMPAIPLHLGGWAMQHGANAALDLSDGLATDLPRLAAASGIRLTIDLERLPPDHALQGVSPTQRASSGEDFGLCVLVPPAAENTFVAHGFTAIGVASEKRPGDSSAPVIFRLGGSEVLVQPSFAH